MPLQPLRREQRQARGRSHRLKEKFLKTPLLIYVCEGTESEIKEWFQTINIAGVPLNEQEILNAVYSGPFVTKAKSVENIATATGLTIQQIQAL